RWEIFFQGGALFREVHHYVSLAGKLFAPGYAFGQLPQVAEETWRMIAQHQAMAGLDANFLNQRSSRITCHVPMPNSQCTGADTPGFSGTGRSSSMVKFSLV